MFSSKKLHALFKFYASFSANSLGIWKKLLQPLIDLRETLFFGLILVPDHSSKVHFSTSHNGGTVRPLSLFGILCFSVIRSLKLLWFGIFLWEFYYWKNWMPRLMAYSIYRIKTTFSLKKYKKYFKTLCEKN